MDNKEKIRGKEYTIENIENGFIQEGDWVWQYYDGILWEWRFSREFDDFPISRNLEGITFGRWVVLDFSKGICK